MKHNLIINTEGKAGKRPKQSFASRLAASMVQPLRTTLDYQGIGRKVFQVEQLPAGALPVYDREIDVCDLIDFDSKEKFQHQFLRIDSNGKASRGRNRVVAPKFETFSNPTIKIADVKQRRFSLIDRKLPKGSV